MDDSSDGMLQNREFEQICRLTAAMDELARSRLLRLEGYRVSVERHLETLAANSEDVDVNSLEEAHRCLQSAGLLAGLHDLLSERRILETHLVFTRHAQKQGHKDTIDIKILESALVDDLFTWHLQPETVQQSVMEVMGLSLEHGDCTIGFNKFVNLRNLLMDRLVCEVCALHSEKEQAVLRLLIEHVSSYLIAHC